MATVTPAPPRQQLRWASWEAQVLEKIDDSGECLGLIFQRQLEIDDDASEADEVRAEFRRQIGLRGHNPDYECIFIRSAVAAVWLGLATGERWATNKASTHLRCLGIAELTKAKKDGSPGWRWTGSRLIGRARRQIAMTRLRDVSDDRRQPE